MPRPLAALVGMWLMAGCASTPVTRDTPASQLIPVGVSEIDITPTEPIRLTGYGSRVAPSEGIGQRLTASALAFGDDTSPTVLITADLIGVPRRLTEDIARRLYQGVGGPGSNRGVRGPGSNRGVRGPGSRSTARVPRAHVAISTTHTHTGPSLPGVLPFIFTSPLDDDQRAVIERYGRDLADRFERVARAALDDRRPARVAWAAGRATFAANRRVLKDGKWTGFGITPDGAVDHDLPILTVRSPDGALRAVLVNYACHATTLEGKANVVHGDWPGVAKELIQKRHPGTVALVAIGTGADANPNPRGGGVPHVEQHAETIANEVDRLLATTLQPIVAAPIGQLQYIDLAFARLPDRQEWEAQANQAHPAGFLARHVLQRLDRGESVSTSAPYPVQTWTFGDRLAMVFLGGEVVADYGLRLKRDLDGSRLWVNAYSNDVSFYVASQRMIPEGGYEVDGSMVYYGQPSRLADDTEDRIVQAVRDLLPQTFRRTDRK